MNNLAYGLTLLGGEERIDRAVELSARTVEQVRAAEAAGDRRFANAAPFILDTHGWALALDGEPERGLDLIVEALSLRPFPQGFLHQAETELMLERPEAAAETARRGLQQAEADAAGGSPTRAAVLERLREVAERSRVRPVDIVPHLPRHGGQQCAGFQQLADGRMLRTGRLRARRTLRTLRTASGLPKCVRNPAT